MSLQPPPLNVPIIDAKGNMPEVWRTYLLSLGEVLGGKAPDDAYYWLSTSDAFLSNGINVGALVAGYLKVSAGTPSTTVTIPAADLSGTTLPASIVNSSLTSVGTVSTGVWSATVIDVAHGGTGVATLAAHGVVIGNGAGAVAVTGAGTSGQVFTSNGASADPTFQAAGAAAAGSLTGTTLASNVVTSSLTAVGTISTGVWNAGAVTSTGKIITSDTTESTSISTGALQSAGGLGVTKALWVGGLASIAGVVKINTTRGSYALQIDSPLDTQTALSLKATSLTAGDDFMDFVNTTGGQAGHISVVNSTTIAYNITSDKRFKEDLGIAVSTDRLESTVVHEFQWKGDGQQDRGVFAQDEVQRAPFGAISKPSARHADKLDDTGLPFARWGVDYSKYVPDLIVGFQINKRRLDAIEALLMGGGC